MSGRKVLAPKTVNSGGIGRPSSATIWCSELDRQGTEKLLAVAMANSAVSAKKVRA